jgi:hypothetical protein
LLGNYLITEDTTMKAFKKLMAAALVCVMALTMLTGCAVSDNLVEKALVNKLNDVSAVSYKHKTDLDDEAQKAWDENKKETSGIILIGNDKVAYNYVIVKKPSDATKKDSWGEKAKKADVLLSTSAKNSDKKIEIGVKVVGDDYVAIVAKAAAKAAK